ncbi:MAG: two-component regulator propeller domain-containing protein, partial [Bacteroidota bacterium]
MDLISGQYEHFYAGNGLPTNYIFRITGDNAGNIYAGTGYEGALKFDGNTWTVYNTWNSPLPNNDVYCVACDDFGNVWFGTYLGLAKLSANGVWSVYDSAFTGVPSNYIRTIVPYYYDLLVATANGGLGILDIQEETWTVFNTENSNIPSDRVWDIAI